MIKTQLADYYVKNQCKQVPFVTLCVKKLWQRMGVKKIIYKLASRQLWMAPNQLSLGNLIDLGFLIDLN